MQILAQDQKDQVQKNVEKLIEIIVPYGVNDLLTHSMYHFKDLDLSVKKTLALLVARKIYEVTVEEINNTV